MAFFACTALGQPAGEAPLRIVRHSVITSAAPLTSEVPATHKLRVTAAVMRQTGWDAGEVIDAVQRAVGLLAQCAIRTQAIELTEFEGPARYRSVFTPVSRDLASRLGLPRPTLFFLADTRNRPAFDAEAVGRGNSRTRPEMTDTVWVARGARDLPVVLAHELVHVLANSGEHTQAPRNLMREETSGEGTLLTDSQCAAIRETGTANGLLSPLR